MKTYFSNGTIKESTYFSENPDQFQIWELDCGKDIRKYAYSNDGIKSTLDGRLADLYDVFRDKLFNNKDQYYVEYSCLPVWIQEAGQNTDCSLSVEEFAEFIDKCKDSVPNLYKHLYLVDCQFLVGTVQNLLSSMENAFINYYVKIAEIGEPAGCTLLTDSNGTIMFSSDEVTCIAGIVETYFTKAYSILDIICKICYELQFMQKDFTTYAKVKSKDVLWGARKKLEINGTKDTLFEHCDFIKEIEALRNEIVHNGTWELNPKVFIRFENGQVVERFMLFPDMSQGHLATFKGRKHFFSSGKKLNDVLPDIHLEFKKRLLNTIEIIAAH